MEDWRGDLLKIGIIPDDMPDQTNFVLFNLDELNDFIKDVVEKARGEVLREVLDKSRDLSMLHLNPHIRTSDVEEMLSKLKQISDMEKKEQNYIRQLLLELECYLFSLKWYDKEGNEIMLKNIIGFDSIFQIIPKRFHKLLEGRIYTQQELDRAREEGKEEGINTVLYPKFRKDKKGNSKRIGWVDTSKLTTK